VALSFTFRRDFIRANFRALNPLTDQAEVKQTSHWFESEIARGQDNIRTVWRQICQTLSAPCGGWQRRFAL